VCGTVRATGTVVLSGDRIDNRSTAAIVRRGVGHVPEGRGTFVALTVEENLRLGAYTRVDSAGIKRDYERMYGYFPVLAERRNQQAGTMSGGEQQMLAIARALMVRPRLLVLDEPSFGLAPKLVEMIFDIVGRINREEGVGMLLVEQNAAIALQMADQAYLLETGRIVMSGSAEDLRNDEAVRKSYLGY
jgi:branched-chain amino acid transport system ATP-binding protein